MARNKPKVKTVNKVVFWAVMGERAMYGPVADSREDVAVMSAAHGAKLLRLNAPARIDIARNQITRVFLEKTSRPKDTLVLLDNDHLHPRETVVRLASYDLGVVGALAFRRGPPYDPCIWVRMEDGQLGQPEEWPEGKLIKGCIVGTGAIAIQRWVFDALTKKGFPYPFWRITYTDGDDPMQGEDWTFALHCEAAGIPHFCDTGLVTPHCQLSTIAEATFRSYAAAQAQLAEGTSAQPEKPKGWFEFGGKK